MPAAAALPLIIGGVGSVASTVIGAKAAGNAADAQVNAANNAAALERQSAKEALDFNKLQYGNSLALGAPYYNTGTSALNRLSFLMGLSPNQGLPSGVINPNAGTGAPSNASFLRPDINTQSPDILPPINSGGFRTMNRYAGDVGFQPRPDTTGDVSSFAPHPSNASQLGSSAQFQPGVVDPSQFGPPQMATDPNDPSASPFPNPDAHNFGNNGTITASTNQGGGAQVPRLDGGGQPGQPAPGGDFGSLSRNFGETFKAPTDVTMQNDPGYQFRIKQGLQALENSAASRGKLLSSDTAKGLNDYAQNAASSEFGNVYNRALTDYTTRYNAFNQDQNTLYNRYANLAGLGQTQANQLSAAGLNTAGNNANILLTSGQQIGNDLQNAGAARGSGYVGSANAITGGINNLGNMAMLLSLLKQGGGSNANAGYGVI